MRLLTPLKNATRVSLLCFLLLPANLLARDGDDYRLYHRTIIEVETAIVNQDFAAALALYQRVFDSYYFAFRRDYQVATQLALHLNKPDSALHYLRLGIAHGWTMKAIRKDKFLAPLRQRDDWKVMGRCIERRGYVALTKLALTPCSAANGDEFLPARLATSKRQNSCG